MDPQIELEELQEQALRAEIDIQNPDGSAKTAEQLRQELGNQEAERQGIRAPQAPQEPPSAPAPTPPTQPEAKAKPAGKGAAKASAAKQPASNPAGSPAPFKRTIPSATPSLLRALGWPDPTDADFALAQKHGYPVAVPGGKAYITRVSFHDTLGGGERPAGSVVILHDAHATNKLEFLTPVP